MPILVAMPSKAWLCSCWIAGIVGSSADGDMDVCVCCVLYRQRYLWQVDHSFRESYWVFMCNCVWSSSPKNIVIAMKYSCRVEYDKTVIVDSEKCCTYWGEIQYYILLECNAANSDKLGPTFWRILTDWFFRVSRSTRQRMLPPMLRSTKSHTHTHTHTHTYTHTHTHTHLRMPTQAHIESEITFWILTHTHLHRWNNLLIFNCITDFLSCYFLQNSRSCIISSLNFPSNRPAFEGSPRTPPVIASCCAISISDVETVSEEHAALIDRSFWFLFLA